LFFNGYIYLKIALEKQIDFLNCKAF
jgi:hypothetical protein